MSATNGTDAPDMPFKTRSKQMPDAKSLSPYAAVHRYLIGAVQRAAGIASSRMVCRWYTVEDMLLDVEIGIFVTVTGAPNSFGDHATVIGGIDFSLVCDSFFAQDFHIIERYVATVVALSDDVERVRVELVQADLKRREIDDAKAAAAKEMENAQSDMAMRHLHDEAQKQKMEYKEMAVNPLSDESRYVREEYIRARQEGDHQRAEHIARFLHEMERAEHEMKRATLTPRRIFNAKDVMF